MTSEKLFKLPISLVLPFIPGLIGGLVTYEAINTWYAYLEKPFFSPPNFVFGPVWTFLYITIGISFYLIWTAKVKKPQIKEHAIRLFFVQLLLNGLWSILFFGLKNPFSAFIEIVILWAVILAMILSFSKISKAAALILIPYLLWVSFATILNFAIVLLN